MPTQIHHLDHTTVVLQFPTHVSLDTLYKEIANWDAIPTPDNGMEVLLSVKEVYFIFTKITFHNTPVLKVHYYQKRCLNNILIDLENGLGWSSSCKILNMLWSQCSKITELS